jgi:hypothetical protein
MDYIEKLNLEEPPPIHRASYAGKNRGKGGLFGGQPSRSPTPRGRDLGAVAPSDSPKTVLLVLVFLVVLIVQGFLYRGVRRDLAEQRTRLEQTNTELAQVWESAKGLDQDRMAQLALLADSLRSMLDSAQSKVELWEETYATMEQRLDDKYRSISTTSPAPRTSRSDPAGLSRLDALERQDRTHRYAFEALSRRAQTQERATRDVSTSLAALRETLRRMDVALAQQPGTASASGQLYRRVESLAGWADGFRRAGLSGDAVQRQFSTLSDELRRIRLRVDSLRPMSRAVTSSDIR